MYRHRHPGRIGNQTVWRRFFYYYSAAARGTSRGSGEQAWTHRAHSTRIAHTQPWLPALKKKNAWSVNPWLLNPRLGSPGPVGKEILRPWAPRRQRDSSSLEQPEVPVLRPREAWRECWFGLRAVLFGSEGKSAHSALENRRQKASGRGLSQGQEHSSKASLAMVSFNGNLQGVLLCREVWKRLSPLPRDLAALPDFFLHSPHLLIDSPK